MSEQRLIDANLLLKEAEESLCENPHTGVMAQAMHTNEHRHFMCMIIRQPTIDPETLPIVQQLMDEIKRAVIERNTLAAIVYKKCNKDCFSYNNGVIKANSGCGYFNNLTRKCMLQEWTGCKNSSENVRLKEQEDYFVAKAKEGKV